MRASRFDVSRVSISRQSDAASLSRHLRRRSAACRMRLTISAETAGLLPEGEKLGPTLFELVLPDNRSVSCWAVARTSTGAVICCNNRKSANSDDSANRPKFTLNSITIFTYASGLELDSVY